MQPEPVEAARREVDVSVVVPAVRDLDQMTGEIEQFGVELARLGRSCEFLVVLDRGRTATSWRPTPGFSIRLIECAADVGEAAALMLGFERARGEMVVTLAPFPQVEPNALGEALAVIEDERADLVVGRRYPRLGSWPNRLQSLLYHQMVSWITGANYQDLGCGFRVMRRQTALELDLYGSLHRYVPLLAENLGMRVLEIKVRQHRIDRPRRIYGVPSVSTGLLDGLAILFLTKFTRRPLRFFGVIGLLLGAIGGGLLAYLAGYRLLGYGGIADRPLLLLAVLLTVLGAQSISIGLLGEVIIFTHARKLSSYRVLREVAITAAAEIPLAPEPERESVTDRDHHSNHETTEGATLPRLEARSS